MLKRSSRFYLLIIALVAWIIYSGVTTAYDWLFIGMALGAMIRQLASTVHAARFTPVIVQVIDWNRIDELLHEHSFGNKEQPSHSRGIIRGASPRR
jgi:hypothetical protein